VKQVWRIDDAVRGASRPPASNNEARSKQDLPAPGGEAVTPGAGPKPQDPPCAFQGPRCEAEHQRCCPGLTFTLPVLVARVFRLDPAVERGCRLPQRYSDSMNEPLV